MLNALQLLNSAALGRIDFGPTPQVPMNQLMSPELLLGFLLNGGDAGMAVLQALGGWSWPSANGDFGQVPFRAMNTRQIGDFAAAASANATPALRPGQVARGESFLAQSTDGTFGAVKITPAAQRLLAQSGYGIDRSRGVLVNPDAKHVHSLLDRMGAPNQDVSVFVRDGALMMRATDLNGITRTSPVPLQKT